MDLRRLERIWVSLVAVGGVIVMCSFYAFSHVEGFCQ